MSLWGIQYDDLGVLYIYTIFYMSVFKDKMNTINHLEKMIKNYFAKIRHIIFFVSTVFISRVGCQEVSDS
jgi:hypothetical protein